MARIRTVKPEFWGHAKTARVSRDARLLFLGLLNESDDFGRQLGSAKRIAGVVFPNDADVTGKKVSVWLAELEREGFVERYGVDGVDYVHIIGFQEHQKVAHPTASRLPPPPSRDTHEDFANGSREPPDSFTPYLGSGSRNMDLGSGSEDKASQDSRIEPNPGRLAEVVGELKKRTSLKAVSGEVQ